jgi:predicted nucleic acid-binding protein
MAAGLLIDTDVLIDYLRENRLAVDYLESLTDPLFLSAMTVGELYAGVREGRERLALEAFLRGFGILTVDSKIAVMGGLFCRDHRKSSGVGLADAFIAATAKVHDLDLITLNLKHYPMLPRVIVPYQKTNK